MASAVGPAKIVDDAVYSSLIIDSGCLDRVINDGIFMLKLLKTIKTSPALYLAYAETENDYDKITSSMRVIEYFVILTHAELYRRNFSNVSKLDNKDLSNLFNAIGTYKEVIIYKNKNYLLKRLSILMAEKIFTRVNAK